MNAQIIKTEMNLKTWGCGESYERNKFKRIKNKENSNKPGGGLWSSPIPSSYGWDSCSRDNDYGDLSTSFELKLKGNIFKIDGLVDMVNLYWKEGEGGFRFLIGIDFEKMLSDGIDAIYLTEKGEQETRYECPGLYGWDCECVLVMNPDCITTKERQEKC